MSDSAGIAPALDRIDPKSRALIELSYRRGLPDTYIEELLGLGRGKLAARRTAAEVELAAELGLELGKVKELLSGLDEQGWTSAAVSPPAEAQPRRERRPKPEKRPEPAPPPPADDLEDEPDDEFDEPATTRLTPIPAAPVTKLTHAPDEPQPEAAEPPLADGGAADGGDEAEQSDDRRDGGGGVGRWLAGLGALLAIAVIVAIVVIANGSDDGDSGSENASTSAATTTQPATETQTETEEEPPPPEDVRGPVVVFERLNGTNGKGTVQLLSEGGRDRVNLKVRDFLEPQGGGYAVWVYNSPQDARLLTSTEQTAFDVTLPLPANYKRYRFVEVSREADENPGHMGLSLLRAPFAELQPR